MILTVPVRLGAGVSIHMILQRCESLKSSLTHGALVRPVLTV
jgi:hypothetical protein